MPPSPRAALSQLQAWLSRHRRGLLVAAAVLLVLRAALPWALARVVEWQGERQLGRQVRVADIDLGLFAGRLAVKGLAVGPLLAGGEPPDEPDADKVLLSIERLDANFQWLTLLRGEAEVAELRVVHPEARFLVDTSGRLVPLVDPRLAAAEPQPEASEPEPEGGGLPVLLDQLSVEGAGFVLVNLARPDLPPLELDFDSLELAQLTLRDGALSVGDVGLRAPRLRVRRDIDLAAFQGEARAAEPMQEAAAQDAAAPSAPARIRVEQIGVDGAELALLLDDEQVSATLHLQVRDLNLVEPFGVELGLGLDQGSFEVSGQLGLEPVSFDGRVAWKALPLSRLLLAAGALPLTLESGLSDGDLAVKAQLGGGAAGEAPPSVSVSGRVDSRNVQGSVAPEAGIAVDLAWQNLSVGLDALELDPQGTRPPSVSIGELRIDAPRARITRSKAAPEVAAAPEQPQAAPPELAEAPQGGAAPSASAAPSLRVASFELTDGDVEFQDDSVTPPVHNRARSLHVSGRDLRWPERVVGSLQVSSGVDDTGKLALDLDLNGGRGRSQLRVDRLELPSWSPYLADAAGYWIEDGQLSLSAKVDVAPKRIAVDGDVDLLDLSVDEVKAGSFEEQFGISLDLALALLRDPRGRIDLPVPVTLGEKGGGASLAPIVASVLRQAIVGALTSPLKGLGMVLGSGGGKAGGMQLKPVACAPGESAPAPGQAKLLEGVARILTQRPGLAVVLRGRTGPADERPLAEQMLAEAVSEDAELPPVSAGFFQKRRLEGALEKRAGGQEVELDADDSEALERWISAVKVPAARRRALAKARAEALRQALLHEQGIAEGSVETGDPLEGEPGVVIQLAPKG